MPKFNVRKSTVIDAPAMDVHACIRDFHQWPKWSPWIIQEPDCRLDYADDGRSYAWEGTVIGAGEMGIISEDAPDSIDYRLVFLKPWKSVASVRFEFKPQGESTEVTWSMESSIPFFMFFMKNFFAAMVGMDYERGLLMLKDYIETGSVPSRVEVVGEESFTGFKYIGVKKESATDAIGESMTSAYGKLKSWMEANDVKASGLGFSLYQKFNMVKGRSIFTAGFPVEAIPYNLPSDIDAGEVPCGKVFAVRHTGPYRHLGNGWATIMGRAQAKVFRQNKKRLCFETYENECEENDEKDFETIIRLPAK
ncbi:MAG: SRPBCC family protein [Limisphaerales bacterium]